MLEQKYTQAPENGDSSYEVASANSALVNLELAYQQNTIRAKPPESPSAQAMRDVVLESWMRPEARPALNSPNPTEAREGNHLYVPVSSAQQNVEIRTRAELLIDQLRVKYEAFFNALSELPEPETMPDEMRINGSLAKRTLMYLHLPNNYGALPNSTNDIAGLILWNLKGEPVSLEELNFPKPDSLAQKALNLAELFQDYISTREQLPEDLQRLGGRSNLEWHQITQQLERIYQIEINESLIDRTSLTRPNVTFEEAVQEEATKRSQLLEYWSRIHAEQGLGWNAKEMFVHRATATGSLVSSEVVLIPDVYDPNTEAIFDNDINLFSRYQTPAAIGEPEYTTRFGFIYNSAHNSNAGMYTDTIYTLDARVVLALQTDLSGLGASILARIQAVATAANHDYVHNTIFPIAENRLLGDPAGSPIFEKGPIHESILEWSRRFDGGASRSVYIPLERHAYITHRQISEAIHRDYPEVKQSLIDEGVEFMGELKSLREIGAITYEMSEYLADFHLRATMTMVDGRDPDLVPLKSSVDELLDQSKSIAAKTTLKFLQNNSIVDIRSDIDSLSQKEARTLLELSLKQPYKDDCLPEHVLAYEQLQTLLINEEGNLKTYLSGFDAWQAKRNRRGENIDNIMRQSAVEFSTLKLQELREIERVEYEAALRGSPFTRPRGDLVDTMQITQEYLRAFAVAAAPTLNTTPEAIMLQHELAAKSKNSPNGIAE